MLNITLSHYLKIVCDRIFGKNNFRNEIIWRRIQGAGKSSQHTPKKWGANTDSILFYSKSNNFEVKPYRKFNKYEAAKNTPINVPIPVARGIREFRTACLTITLFSLRPFANAVLT